MKRIALLAAAAAIITGTVVPAAAASGSSPAFTLNASIAGGITVAKPLDNLTFVFTETNHTNETVNENVVLVYVRNVKIHQPMTCVVDGAIQPMDGRRCEPGGLAAGESASIVVATNVHSQPVLPATAAARACLVNGDTGVRGPCKTVYANLP